jgi:hypothetical protein
MISTAFKSELSKAIIEKIVTKSDASNLDEFFFLKKKNVLELRYFVDLKKVKKSALTCMHILDYIYHKKTQPQELQANSGCVYQPPQ